MLTEAELREKYVDKEKTWEARMAARAAERARKAQIDAGIVITAGAQAAYDANKDRPWLNGWQRISPQTVFIMGGCYCVCCGRCTGLSCVVFDPDFEPPPHPEFPFTPADCPICPK